MEGLDQLEFMVDDMLEGFRLDPAHTDYQKGYLAALIEVKRVVTELQESLVK